MRGEKEIQASKLTLAAEQLVQAACEHVESTSLTIGRETVESLKKLSVDSSSINESVAQLKDASNAKMDSLIQSIVELKAQMTQLNEKIEVQTKNQNLEWAISNTGLVTPFSFYDKSLDRNCSSVIFIKTILFAFRRGEGWYITNCSMSSYYHADKAAIEAGEKKFREALSNQILELTGQKPRISLENNGYAIFYN
jgi:cell division protein FtsB